MNICCAKNKLKTDPDNLDPEQMGIMLQLQAFKHNAKMQEVAFVDQMTMGQRNQIHIISEYLGLHHITTGTPDARVVLVSKRPLQEPQQAPHARFASRVSVFSPASINCLACHNLEWHFRPNIPLYSIPILFLFVRLFFFVYVGCIWDIYITSTCHTTVEGMEGPPVFQSDSQWQPCQFLELNRQPISTSHRWPVVYPQRRHMFQEDQTMIPRDSLDQVPPFPPTKSKIVKKLIDMIHCLFLQLIQVVGDGNQHPWSILRHSPSPWAHPS
jgi:hypothetical protein